MFKFESTPTFSKHHKIRKFTPQSPTQLDKKGVCVLLHGVCVPVTVIFIPNNHFSIHYLLSRVSRLPVSVNSCELFKIRLKYLRPCLTIVQIYSINSSPLCKLLNLFDQQLPSLNFSVIQHHCVFILDSLTVSSIANLALAFII